MKKTYKNLVFEGGGVKGIAYAGAIEILEKNDLLSTAENVAGTSAGAITATLVALNYNADEITKAIMNLDFKSFEDGFNPFRLFTSYGLYKGNAFLNWMKSKIRQVNLDENITFEELHNLGGYKGLKIFATDLYTKNIQEFSFKKTPKTIIAEAARASMSIPLFFKAWQFSNQIPNDHLFIDGGVLYNYPIDVFEDLEDTLGFYLTNLHSKPKLTRFGKYHFAEYIKYLLETLLKSQNIAFDQDKEEQLHSVLIDDLGISATDFKLTKEMKLDLIGQGKLATKLYLKKEIHPT